MNRALLKQDAKNAMRMANPHPVLTTLVYLAISVAASIILGVFEAITGMTGAVTDSASVSFSSALILFAVSIVISLLLGAVQFGYYAYSLKVFKMQPAGIGELFSYFPMLFKILGLSLWIGLFTFLWCLLFIIPGIIAALRYSQAFFILAENPDMSIRECVNESKALMSGHVGEFFVLQLSFILWGLLCGITCGIAALYVTPYQTITFAGYYLSLKPVDDGYYQ